MDQYVRSILEKKTKSPATLKNRVSYITSLYRQLGSSASDLSFLNNKKAVMALVKSSDNLGTQKTRLFHLSETCKADKSSAIKPDIKAYYAAQADKLKKPVADLEATNVMSDKQKEKHISIASANLRLEEHIRRVFDDYEIERIAPISDEDFNKWHGKAKKNAFTLAKAIQECVIPSLYVWQTALRNDWAELTITRRIVIPNSGNWLQIKKDGTMYIILNEYKNAAHMGKQKIQLTTKCQQLMRIWLELLERILGDKPEHPLYYSINAKGDVKWIENADTMGRQLSRFSVKIFGRAATINTFRHAHEIALQETDEYKRMTVKERTEAHAKLLHSLTTGVKYMLQRRDANLD